MLTNDVKMTSIIIKLSAGTQNKIPYKTYISNFSYVENWQNNIILLLIYDMTLVYNADISVYVGTCMYCMHIILLGEKWETKGVKIILGTN